MGLAFFFGAVHAFMIPSDVAVYMPLRIYILAVFVFGIYSFIYHSVLGKYLIKKYKYVVSSVQVLGGNVTEVLLKPADQRINFISGQFAFISFKDSSVSSESHPFSLSSSVSDETISFNMKNLGDYTSVLPNLSVGSEALIEGPFGKFSYKDGYSKNQIWIAGGIGVTPFLSMIDAVSKEDGYKIDFYYCLKNEKEAVHLEDLKKYENVSIKIIPYYSDVEGFINAEKIKAKSLGLSPTGELNGFEDKDIFLCAPPVMISALRKQLRFAGVKNTHIHSEEFNLRD
jgi:predicted ferric reductase